LDRQFNLFRCKSINFLLKLKPKQNKEIRVSSCERYNKSQIFYLFWKIIFQIIAKNISNLYSTLIALLNLWYSMYWLSFFRWLPAVFCCYYEKLLDEVLEVVDEVCIYCTLASFSNRRDCYHVFLQLTPNPNSFLIE